MSIEAPEFFPQGNDRSQGASGSAILAIERRGPEAGICAASGTALADRLESLWFACVIVAVAGVLPAVMLLHR